MSDNAKAFLLFLLLLSIVLPPIAWSLPELLPDAVLGFCRFVLPVVGLAALVGATWALFRPDRVPNFLRRLGSEFFERDGFCFVILPSVLGNQCLLNVHYQNRFNRPCKARLLLRPEQNADQPPVPPIAISVECAPGCYGVASAPWGVPENLQGREITLDLAAQVKWPEGQGQPIRFGYGLKVGHTDLGEISKFTPTQLAAQSRLLLLSPARTVVSVPSPVSTSAPDDSMVVNQTLWRPGDHDDPHLHTRIAVLSATM